MFREVNVEVLDFQVYLLISKLMENIFAETLFLTHMSMIELHQVIKTKCIPNGRDLWATK